MQKEKKYYTIGAITKACALLEKLSEKRAWELTSLCKALNMPKTTVHRMLLTLEDEGFVIQEQRGGLYGLTYKLFSLGRKAVSYINIVDESKKYALCLLEQIDETVNLCVISGTDMLILDKQPTTQALKPDNIVGTSFPIFYSASGKAFIAFSSQDYQDTMLEKIHINTRPNITDRAFEYFLQELDEVRKTGLAYDNEEIFAGVRCIAVPIFDFNNVPIAAFSVTAPSIRLNKKNTERIELCLLEAGKKLSLQLGSTHALYSPSL